MRRVRVLTAVLVAGGIGLALAPLAQAADATVVPAVEGWYQANPTCAQPTGCLSLDTLPVSPPVDAPIELPLSPYPAGSLHVGWAGGTETARAYLAFPFDGLSGTLTGASLNVPLDTAPADGDTSSSTVKAQVCLATAEVVPTSGAISPPPAISCDRHADLKYVATPAPHLTADLAPLLLGLTTTSGIVLLPDPTKNTQTDAWRVVFSAHDRADAAKTPPAQLTLTLSADEVVSTPERPTVELPDVAVPSDGGMAPAPTTGFVPGDPQVGAPQVPQVSPELPQGIATTHTVTVGYAYPAVWMLPLVLLVLVPMATRALTKDLAPA